MLSFYRRQSDRSRRYPENRKGTTTVEMAMMLPVFVMSILGIIEVGRAMMLVQVLEDATRTGVRMAILSNTNNSQVTSAVQTLVHNTTNVATGNITVAIGVNGNNSAALSTAVPGDTISVSVQVPFSAASWVPPNFLKGKTLTSLCTM